MERKVKVEDERHVSSTVRCPKGRDYLGDLDIFIRVILTYVYI
jgi:hypothetical protein